MKKSTLLLILALIAIGLLGAFFIRNRSQNASSETNKYNSTGTPNLVKHDKKEQDYDHDHSVEIEGRNMKALTLQQIADLWQIDSKTLLNKIIQEFGLKGNYTTETVLEDMRNEYKFSPAVIKDIAEKIKQE